MDINRLIVYRDIEGQPLLRQMTELMQCAEKEPAAENRSALYEILHGLLERGIRGGFYGNLWHCYLTELLVNDENGYSQGCERRGRIDGTINALTLHDMRIFKRLFDYDVEALGKKQNVPELHDILHYRPASADGRGYNGRIRDRICTLAESLAKSGSAEEMKDTLTDFYREFGVGKFGLHKAFRVNDEGGSGTQILPIKKILHVTLEDLVGYEFAKRELIDNTEAFVEGKIANNCLLYGDAGTGKSSSIKAIANRYYEKGLRIIELYRHQYRNIHDVIEQIKDRNYRFILYLDDLSFEEFETDYKYLKAIIEGGLEKKPENVLIYATSNRRHLVRESFRDKPSVMDDDLHKNDTVQEKISLSSRFGVTIYFGKPDPAQFKEIVRALAKRNHIGMDEHTLYEEAMRWEMRHGGLSGRTAQQFIDYLLGAGIKER